MRCFSFYLTNLTNLLNFLFPFLIKIPSKCLPVQIENMVNLVSRTGRHLQRYEKGYRLVVGCIPYRYKKSQEPTSVEELEVLVISAQNGQGMLFPKGGWENDECMEEAAKRETEEEAGVIGVVQEKLGPWHYKSKRSCIMHESYMFPLLVHKELDCWPEKNIRKRRWVSINEAREVCHNWWMREALEELLTKSKSPSTKLGNLEQMQQLLVN
ncbi:nudix hydrolase 4-like [Populus alba x Populus x berolinensis]|uniref:Nudix hydrolase 4-like n=1 Tax=Populus alba x Populus x berolinensis TaxID=444605 RepID=A0AAD6M256_9ROSI|nr:nudix hydrolase 4-like [Populus alba x Populus x berolinensis]